MAVEQMASVRYADKLILKAGTPGKSSGGNSPGHMIIYGVRVWIVSDQMISKLKKLGIISWDGGKIIDKANAWGNTMDTVSAIINPLAMTWTPDGIGGLNWILLSSTYKPMRTCAIGCHTRDRKVRPLIKYHVGSNLDPLPVYVGGKGMGLSEFERIGECSMPTKGIWSELILTEKNSRPKPDMDRLHISYRVSSALGPKWWDSRDYLIISPFVFWGDIYTIKDSLRQVGQGIGPKSGMSVIFKNWGFPKGCKSYSDPLGLITRHEGLVGNGVSVVSKNEGRQLLNACEYSSGRKYTTNTKVRKASSGVKLAIRPIYEQLYDIKIWKAAYDKLKSKPGNMTPGTDNLTLDGLSIEWVEETIKRLRDGTFQFKPSKRKLILKPNGGTRPLGIPSPRDKIVQEVLRKILESVYEPLFKDTSHGFRPKRSTGSAVFEVRKWNGIKWIIEGDIKKYFDTVDHHVLAFLIEKRIKDQKFIELYWKLVKAGYVNGGEYKNSELGVPQGGVLSPILSNIYLHEFDEYMEQLMEKYTTNKRVSKANPEFRKLKREIGKFEGVKKRDMSKETWENLKELKLEKEPSVIRTKDTGMRVYYNRYADDWVIGVTGSKEIAEKIKEDVKEFLNAKLKLTLSDDKTKITHIVEDKTLYLGFNISGRHRKYTASQIRDVDTPQGKRRSGYSQIIIEAPISKLEDSLEKKGFKRKGEDESTAKTAWIHMRIEDIIQRFNWIIEGILNYYRPVENRNQLSRIVWLLQFSAVYTIARKMKISPKQVWTKYGNPLTVKFHRGGEEKVIRLSKPKTLKRDLTFHLGSCHNFDPFSVASYVLRSNHIWDQPCSICKSETEVEMHHVKYIKVGKTTGFTQIMRNMNTFFNKKKAALRARKQIPVCKNCHKKIHSGKYDGKSL